MYILVLIISAFALIACQMTSPHLESPIEPTRTVAENPVVSPEDQPPEWDLEYCQDSIYGQYIIEHHKPLAENIRKKSKRRDFFGLVTRNKLSDVSLQSRHISFPMTNNEKVEKWVRHFQSKGRITFLKWLVKRESFKDIIHPILREHGVPIELEFMAMIESGFNNRAYSRARATGTWQFMPLTAKRYGLKINFWVDERKNLEKATHAAARYLKDLYHIFDDWHLAIAAYNAGPGKIKRALRRTKSNTFWDIADSKYIRLETKQYVPKIIAALILASEPEKFGFQAISDNRHYTPLSTVEVKSPVLMKEISSYLGIPSKTLTYWNPDLKKGVTPPKSQISGGYYRLRLPESLVSKFESSMPRFAKLEIKDFKLHKIKRGETLGKIARTYKVPVKKILNINPDIKPKRLRPGKSIAIPIPTVIRRIGSENKRTT